MPLVRGGKPNVDRRELGFVLASNPGHQDPCQEAEGPKGTLVPQCRRVTCARRQGRGWGEVSLSRKRESRPRKRKRLNDAKDGSENRAFMSFLPLPKKII